MAIQLNDEEEKDCRGAKLPSMRGKKMGVHCSRKKSIETEPRLCNRPVMSGSNRPCEVCSPNRALTESFTPLAVPKI